MVLNCDTCGREFTAARSDARYCSGKCRTGAYRVRRNPDAKPVRRRPIADTFTSLVWALEKSVSRLERVVTDDRFDSAVRKGTIHTGQLANLQRRIGVLLGDDDPTADEPMTDEEMNRAAADQVHEYLDALVRAHSALRPGVVRYMVRRLRDTADSLDHPESAVDERAGASDWSRRVQGISAAIPMEDLTDDEVLELRGAVEYLHNYIKGELITRR